MHNILYTYTKETQLRLNYIQWTSCGFSKYDIPVHVQDVQVQNKLGILLLLVVNSPNISTIQLHWVYVATYLASFPGPRR